VSPRKIVKIDAERCTGCQRCKEICPVAAIEGDQGKPQTINARKCVMCGHCVQICSAYASQFETYPTGEAEGNPYDQPG